MQNKQYRQWLKNNLKNYFIYHKLCTELEKLEIPSNRRNLLVAKGIFSHNDQAIPIYFLPHPDAKLTLSARKQAWEFCFGIAKEKN